MVLNFRESRLSLRAISSTILRYSGESVRVYADTSSGINPSRSSMMRLVMSSFSLLLAEKFMKGQAYTSGGQAILMCTSLAPMLCSSFVLSLSWVPLTMLSSQKSTLFPSSMLLLGMSFIFATRFLIFWLAGIKDLGQVGVYLLMALM